MGIVDVYRAACALAIKVPPASHCSQLKPPPDTGQKAPFGAGLLYLCFGLEVHMCIEAIPATFRIGLSGGPEMAVSAMIVVCEGRTCVWLNLAAGDCASGVACGCGAVGRF